MGIGNDKNQYKPILMNKDDPIEILIMGNKKTPKEWNKGNYKQFSVDFKIEIETFLICLRVFSICKRSYSILKRSTKLFIYLERYC